MKELLRSTTLIARLVFIIHLGKALNGPNRKAESESTSCLDLHTYRAKDFKRTDEKANYSLVTVNFRY